MSDWTNDMGALTQTPYAEAKMVRAPTIQERLDMAVKNAEERLAAVKEARDIFSKYPDIEKLLNIMQRGMF
jgi:hypothetical protein